MNGNTTNDSTPRKDFETVKRTFENALASGGDYSTPLYDLATAVAYSVVNKCIDPQRKTAAERETISDSGNSPAMLELKRGIATDRCTLDSTRRNANAATHIVFNSNGDCVTETADKDAAAGLASILGESITDSFDVVQEAAAALLGQAAEHASGENWLDRPYTVRRLSKRVYIQLEDSAAYRDDETTPIQEVYKAVRRYIQNSRAMRTDPRNGYSYIEEMAVDPSTGDVDPLETIYRRLNKYADLGGYDCNGNYTTDRQTVDDCAALVQKMDLTDRQAQILKLRLQGKGNKAIATYLGVSKQAIAKTVAQIQKKAVEIGLTA